MKNKAYGLLLVLSLTNFVACSQNSEVDNYNEGNIDALIEKSNKAAPHRYGGWYCPDNLNGFPAVNIADWENVPVVKGRLATKEETKTESALIFVDNQLYPNAKSLDISLPQLAKFYCVQSKREELIIVIQALNISEDSIVGFRYLNGGNGSARLNEVEFISEKEAKAIPSTQFVSQTITINATPEVVWEILTTDEYASKLQPIFDEDQQLKPDWKQTTNVNFHYVNSGDATSSFGEKLFGNFYIQNDYDNNNYTEKIILLENKETNKTELQLVFGSFGDDYENQRRILTKWAQQVQVLSEKN